MIRLNMVCTIPVPSVFYWTTGTTLDFTRSRLLYPGAPGLQGERMTEELIALLRDQDERCLLAELAAGETLPVVALTDGSLDLFREPEEERVFNRLFNDYLDALERLSGTRAAVAGYVDKTRANLVVSMLELLLIKAEDLRDIGHGQHPLQFVTDFDLFSRRIKPGERSAVFMLQSSNSHLFGSRPGLAMHFFYLNVGQVQHRTWHGLRFRPGWRNPASSEPAARSPGGAVPADGQPALPVYPAPCP